MEDKMLLTHYTDSVLEKISAKSQLLKWIKLSLSMAALLLFTACGGSDSTMGPDPDPDPGPDPTPPKTGYTFIQEEIFNQSCAIGGCHDSGTQQNGVNLSSYSTALNSIGVQYGTEIIDPGNPGNSPIVDKISNNNPQFGSRMPEGGSPLSSAKIDSIVAWIEDGAANN